MRATFVGFEISTNATESSAHAVLTGSILEIQHEFFSQRNFEFLLDLGCMGIAYRITVALECDYQKAIRFTCSAS